MQIDATAPGMNLDNPSTPAAQQAGAAAAGAAINEAAGPAGSLMNGGTALSGAVTERPVDVAVTWTTPDGLGDQVGVAIRCNGIDLLSIAAGQFISATQTLRW